MKRTLSMRLNRQVPRAENRIKLSVPDLRTWEEIRAAPEASRATDGRGIGNAHNRAPSFGGRMSAFGSDAKTKV